MTPAMLRAMGKSLLEDVNLESNRWFASNKDVPDYIATGMLVLTGISKACFEAANAGVAKKVNPAESDSNLLDRIELLCRRNCTTKMVNGYMETFSDEITVHGKWLRMLAKQSSFRIVADGGGMIVGFWPEHDPQKQTTGKETPHG